MKGDNWDISWTPEYVISLPSVSERKEESCLPLPQTIHNGGQAIHNGGYLSSGFDTIIIYHKVAWEANGSSIKILKIMKLNKSARYELETHVHGWPEISCTPTDLTQAILKIV